MTVIGHSNLEFLSCVPPMKLVPQRVVLGPKISRSSRLSPVGPRSRDLRSSSFGPALRAREPGSVPPGPCSHRISAALQRAGTSSSHNTMSGTHQHCPFHSSSDTAQDTKQARSQIQNARASKRSPSSPRRLTERPDLRRVPSSDVLYLPPLLSLLPITAESPEESSPEIMYTLSRLPQVDEASVALHRALHAFQPITENYATEPYEESFNWKALRLPKEVQREW